MTALVTGGAGFIGSALARRLLAGGHEVRVLDNLSTGSADGVPEDAEFVEGDLRDLEVCRKAADACDVVFHQAALPSVPRSIEDPLTTNEVNVGGTLNLLAAAAQGGCRRFVYASSSSVYGDPPEALRIESQRPLPISPYAASKLAGEHYIAAFAAAMGLATVSLRYFNVFGPGQDPHSKYAAVFPRFIAALLRGEAPEIYGDGEQTRDFTFIDDVVEANLLAAAAPPEADGEAFNVGAGRPRSVNETLRAISEAAGVWTDPIFSPPRPGDVRHSLADLTRSRAVLRYDPKAEWEGAVAATVEWFRTRLS